MSYNLNPPHDHRGQQTHLEPEVIVEVLDRIAECRRVATAEFDGDLCSAGGADALTVNPVSMGEAYGVSDRAVLRYMSRGRDYFVSEIEHKQRQWSPAYALAPEGVTLAEFDLYMFEIEECLDDGQKIKACYQSNAMIKRHPCAKRFSLTLLRKAFKAWSEEYHQRDDRGDGKDVTAFDLVKIPKAA